MKATKKLLALVLAVVMIMAMAATASAATVTIENSQKDTKYTFYKMFEYDADKKWYKVTDVWKEVLKDYFEFDTNGYILKKTTDKTDAALAAELKTKIPTGAPSETFNSATTPVTADLALGYYLMVSELGGTESKASLAAINADGLTIREKNTPEGLPTIKKTYADGTTGGSYNIGDIAEFKVVITVEEGGYEYTVHDSSKDLKDFTSFTYELSTSTGAKLTTKEVVTEGICADCTFHISLKTDKALEAYDTITITYKATVTGENPSNKVSLTTDIGSDDPGTSSYNYGFTVQKTDGTNQLNGAEFILSRVKTIDGVDTTQYAKFDSTGKLTGWTANESEAIPLVVGSLKVFGLAAGDYTLTEKTAPIGYKKLVGSINVNIEPVLDSEGKPTAKAVITASGAGVTVSGSADTGFTVAVKNNPIDPLPETGGMGTTMFYMLGGLMAAAALVLLTSKKRMFA